MADVYVQVPAYRDAELQKTLRDLYAKAERPERLRTCVLWQHGDDEVLPAAVRALPNLEIVAVPHDESRGCNWARRMLQERWRGEPYTLLLDSHHRFTPGWDRTLVAMHEELARSGVEKPLITGYLPSYVPALEPRGRRRRPYRMYASGRDDGLLIRLTSFPLPFWRQRTRPDEADFLSLHFVFARGAFNAEIQFDPDIYFFGDEVATGLRAYTAGYDFFHPHVVVGWHSFDRDTRVPHWNDHDDWHVQHRRSLDKLRRLFTGVEPEARLLGTRRSIRDYESRIMTRLVTES